MPRRAVVLTKNNNGDDYEKSKQTNSIRVQF